MDGQNLLMDSVFRHIHIENNAFDYCIMQGKKTVVFFEILVLLIPFDLPYLLRYDNRVSNHIEIRCKVKMDVLDGNKLSSTISMSSIRELCLKVGGEATTVIQATSVMITVD